MANASNERDELVEALKERARNDTSPDQSAAKAYVDYLLREQELRLKIKESQKWFNPVFVTIIVAFVSILGNGFLNYWNSGLQQKADKVKHEQNLILESMKAPTEKVFENFDLLLKASLLDKAKYADLEHYVAVTRNTGRGPQIGGVSSPTDRAPDCAWSPDLFRRYEEAAKAAGSWAWMQYALHDICVSEHGSQLDRDRIVEYLRTAYPNLDEKALTPATPWASAFVVWALKKADIALPSGGLPPQAFLSYGEQLNEPKFGCIVVISRGPLSSQNRVTATAFYIEEVADEPSIRVLLGNSLDQVRVSVVRKSDIRAYRLPKP